MAGLGSEEIGGGETAPGGVWTGSVGCRQVGEGGDTRCKGTNEGTRVCVCDSIPLKRTMLDTCGGMICVFVITLDLI